MKLIKQTKLHFREGNSDKVYEADICEVGDNQYVVNFRYGKRGANLTEGSKTAFPVDLKKAEETFDKLIKEKTSKGYQDVTEGGEAVAPTQALTKTGDATTDRKNAILWHLEMGVSNPAKQRQRKWNIKRVMWRAGELGMTEATPFLLKLADKGGDKDLAMHQYCALWALGRCAVGTEHENEAVELLSKYWNNKEAAEMVRRAAANALVVLAKGEARKTFLKSVTDVLPAAVVEVLDKSERLLRILQSYKAERSHNVSTFACLPLLYLLVDDKHSVRKALAEFLTDVPLRPNYFKHVRAIIKAAEQRLDGQMWGVIVYRIEKQAEHYKKVKKGRAYVNHQWLGIKSEMAKSDSKLAYSFKTREYLRRRAWKMLQTLGNQGDTRYVKLAAGILLGYDDARDAKPTNTEKNWTYDNKTRRWSSEVVYFDKYAEEILLNKILYKNSSRYEERPTRWVCKNGFEPGQAAPDEREEAFPELWDKMPQAYVHLLIETKSTPVAEFALRAMKKSPEYQNIIARFDHNLIIQLLQRPVELVAYFALDLIKARYNPQKPDTHLIQLLLASPFATMRKQALTWIGENPALFYVDTDLIRSFMIHQLPEMRQWVKDRWADIVGHWNEDKKRVFIGRMVSFMIQLPNDIKHNISIRGWGELLLKEFGAEMKMMSVDVIGDLLQHPLVENKFLAAQLFEQHALEAERIPMDYTKILLFSNDATLRAAGIRQLSKFSDAGLVKNQKLLIDTFISTYEDLRNAGRTLLERIANGYEEIAKGLVDTFVPYLLRKETWEGLHANIHNLLTITLEKHLHVVDRELIFRLLNANHVKAQELACVLIERYVPAQTLTMRSIIRFADHEILAARQLAWTIFKNNVARVKYEREEAVRLLDSTWDDSREFARTFFKEHFTEADWTPELLVSICDSVRPDIQALGRELITRFFKEENGEEYLLKLAQHPRPELQLYATNYLERFASDNFKHLQRLEFYFITVLSQVNKGRVAKDRIFAFLHKEALKTPEAAQLVSNIVSRISATCAIGDKATCIELMRDIHETFPHVEMVAKILE